MTISKSAFDRIKLREGKPVSQHDAPRLRPAVKPGGFVQFLCYAKAAEAATMSLRRCAFSRRAE